ncbi:PREDICTED: KAT8 regulatory NSL complex subunit 3 [Dinoponera quadriceps]|uniref:KAT8 regulatory NSL complex subunit 3 n=1 Tax=Dinoponera quadriceps TaxID=609295 RepID=A0A6P3Y3Z3_DINQU|nr:PREDICTED: KAT8 regulatory NSL complex subunit 3 [Dinoponera quadriceps]XP_014485014.1 PREDICTED: KAT8 regulatory NSL complex subunit 3 [Dinoponera quadriceps]XP_014485015.1 PREDICTED: KAT8 regulatory NSL complex subunit 3 [Dinoponera quadriceps]
MLTSVSAAPSTSMGSSGLPSPTIDSHDDSFNKLTDYLHKLAGNHEMEVDIIVKDHCYARPWNWRPENIYVKPVKRLFFSRNTVSRDKLRKNEEVVVDDIGSDSTAPPFDLEKARQQMDEFQRVTNNVRQEEDEDWEDKISKELWSSVQTRIFTKVTRILSSERLARLAKATHEIEPIFRRTSVDIAARRFRETLASTGWDWRLVHWLHNLLFEHLPQEYLVIYLDILQTLRPKIPQLIDKMIAIQPNINSRTGSVTWETLGYLFKRSWDPVSQSLSGSRPKKLPGNPILIIVPSGNTSTVSPRQTKWVTQLSSLGMVVTVHNHLGLAANRMTMLVFMDQLVQATRTKIQDVRSDYPGKPIILVGFNTGSALACQVAQMEHVTAIICIGFPFATVEGKRGTPDDTLMDIRSPVMFVIGQNATLVTTDDLEELREKMLVETSLVVVGTADDYLRISTSKKILEGITQSMVDRCILDEIGDFVGGILLQPHPLPLRPSALAANCDGKSKKESHKRRNSTSSSVESEPNSPVAKKSLSNASTAMPSVGTNATSGVNPKVGTFSAQANLMQVSGQHTNHTPNPKRKRTVGSQKAQFGEHIKASRLPAQTNINAENGITLNIGTLASLAPIGPIRLAPTTVGQAASTSPKTSGTSKSTSASVKIPKIFSTNVPLQGISKIKTLVPTYSPITNVVSHNYRQVSVPDKSGDAKLMSVFTASGNQIRVNTTAAGALKPIASGGALSNLLQAGKNTSSPSSTLPTNATSSARVSSASSILLTTSNSPANSIAPSTSSNSKATEEMDVSGDAHQAMLGPTRSSLDVSKPTHLPLRPGAVNSDNSPHGTPCGNIVIIENPLHNRGATSSVIVPFNSQGCCPAGVQLPGKLKISSHKSVKAMPKITVNANNLQRLQKGKPAQQQAVSPRKNLDIDDELGNILDIPIIFAKDDDSLGNAVDKVPAMKVQPKEQTPPERPKLNTTTTTTTKVVLISNKQDKLQQAQQSKLAASSAVICPANVQNLNHLILQARSQQNSSNGGNNVASTVKSRVGPGMESRLMQPTVKYTKIILAKRNTLPPQQQSKRPGEQAATTLDDAPKILTFEKDDDRFVQASHSVPTYDDPFAGNVLEIEDAIKTNIIERKYASASVEPSSISPAVTLADDDCLADILNETELDDGSEQPVFDADQARS